MRANFHLYCYYGCNASKILAFLEELFSPLEKATPDANRRQTSFAGFWVQMRKVPWTHEPFSVCKEWFWSVLEIKFNFLILIRVVYSQFLKLGKISSVDPCAIAHRVAKLIIFVTKIGNFISFYLYLYTETSFNFFLFYFQVRVTQMHTIYPEERDLYSLDRENDC